MSECKFEQVPLNCGQCGAYVGVLGTCEDFALCDNCNMACVRAYDPKAKGHGYDAIYSPNDEEGKPPFKRTRVYR